MAKFALGALMTARSATVVALHRFPVKGLSAERLEKVTLVAGQTMPLDRAWAIENGPGRFDPAEPHYLPKVHFLMLMRNERLASLETRLDEAAGVLTIFRAGRQVARGDLNSAIGRQLIEQFMAAYMRDELRGAPKIVSARGHSFSDVAAKCIHIINLDSLAALERVAGRPLDPLRFRANVHVSGFGPWAELDLVGQRLKLGSVDVEVFKRTTRCEATSVNPVTAQRDIAVPALLQRHFGHTDFGVYAKVTGGGTLTVGDSVTMAVA
jgi:uncharacterized protein YcbX